MSFEERRSRMRAALEAPVKLQFETSSQPLSGFTGDVSEGGMFVRSEKPSPVGTLVRFELDFGGPGGLVKSVGEVAWIRVRWAGAGRPAGMGIRFRYLEPEALETIRERVAAFLAENPEAAELPPEPAAASPPPPSAPPPAGAPPPERPPPSAERSRPGAAPGPEPPRRAPRRAAPEQRPGGEGVPRSRWILLAILGILLLVWLLL